MPQHKDKSSEEYYSSRHIEYNQERDRVKYKYFFEEGSQGNPETVPMRLHPHPRGNFRTDPLGKRAGQALLHQ